MIARLLTAAVNDLNRTRPGFLLVGCIAPLALAALYVHLLGVPA